MSFTIMYVALIKLNTIGGQADLVIITFHEVDAGHEGKDTIVVNCRVLVVGV